MTTQTELIGSAVTPSTVQSTATNQPKPVVAVITPEMKEAMEWAVRKLAKHYDDCLKLQSVHAKSPTAHACMKHYGLLAKLVGVTL